MKVIVKRRLLWLFLFLISSPICARDLPENGGLSYFAAFGVENIYFTEKASILPVESEVTVTNPILNSGGLFVLSDLWYFSIDNTTTMYPYTSEESWHIEDGKSIAFVDPNSGNTLAEYDSSDNPIQQNSLSYGLTTHTTMAHRRLTRTFDVMTGLRYRFHLFKRFDPRSDLPEIQQNWEIVEETVGELIGVVGFGYKSGPLEGRRYRVETRFVYGHPLLSRVENTNYPGTVFTETSGQDLEVAGFFSWAATQKFHTGLMLQADARWRDAQRKMVGNREVEIPENFTLAYRAAFSVSWNN